MLKKIKGKKAITLISLVVTIVVLIVLSGISINLILGENGLIERAKTAKENDTMAQQEEKNRLNELYSSIMVATSDSAEITISMKDLNSLIESKVNEKTNIAIQNALETEDITSSLHLNTDYVSQRSTVRMTKSGNTITLTAYLNILQDIPNLATIITIDDPYRTSTSYVSSASVSNTTIRYVNVNSNGNITVTAIDADMYITMAINLIWQI